MELYKEILSKVLENEEIQVVFPHLKINAAEIVAEKSYAALLKIKKILEDTKLGDDECFEKIEEIVRVFEELGSDCGARHDF